ncbi:hypothetical protein F5883DRAFT_512125, partial [Diaporthe sp. PMI_573]
MDLDCAVELPNVGNPYKPQVCEQPNILGYLSNTSKISRLAQQLIKHDAETFFAENMEGFYEFWLRLLVQTTFPPNIRFTDRRVLDAFRAVDSIITSRDNAYPLSRLAYVRLANMTVSLKEIIANNRRNVLKNNRRDASVAIDIYVNAQDIMPGSNESDLQELRKNLNKRIDLSNHWADLGGDAPLLLLTYSDKAEGIMANHSILRESLKALSNEMLQIYPAELVRTSIHLGA